MVACAAGVRQTACSESTDTLTSSTGTINSPGYSSGSYPNNAYCQWLIQAPASKVRLFSKGKKGKGSPYTITERKVPELIPVLGSQPAGDASHNPGGRLPLLSATPAVTPATLKRAAANFAAW